MEGLRSYHVDARALSGFSDDEVAAEHYRRCLRKLGDPRICVGTAAEQTAPEHQR